MVFDDRNSTKKNWTVGFSSQRTLVNATRLYITSRCGCWKLFYLDSLPGLTFLTLWLHTCYEIMLKCWNSAIEQGLWFSDFTLLYLYKTKSTSNQWMNRIEMPGKNGITTKSFLFDGWACLVGNWPGLSLWAANCKDRLFWTLSQLWHNVHQSTISQEVTP